MKYQAVIKKGTGKLTIGRREEMENYISSLGRLDEDVPMELDLKPRKKTRSLSQNKFYWLCLGFVLDAMYDLGHSRDEIDKESLHEFFLGMFNYTEIINETTGEVRKIAKKSSTMTTQEFSEYFEHVKRWCAEWLSLVLPEPNEQLQID